MHKSTNNTHTHTLPTTHDVKAHTQQVYEHLLMHIQVCIIHEHGCIRMYIALIVSSTHISEICMGPYRQTH